MATALQEEPGSMQAMAHAFVMIVVSEIGDKTFLIAAIMATRHSRITVFAGAFASLVVMSVLSAALGKIILGLIPKLYTLYAAALLFLVFGIKMLQEALAMPASHMADEMREVEEELEEDNSLHDPSNRPGSMPLEALEEGRVARSRPLENTLSGAARSRDASPAPQAPPRTRRSRSSSPSVPRRIGFGRASISLGNGLGPLKESDFVTRMSDAVRASLQVATNPVFAQAFILTFLGEWGDRSQIATIALAGAHSIPVIAFGTIIGHALCTFIAVVGGRLLSTKLSVKHISLLGAIAFLIFAVMYAFEAYHEQVSPTPIEVI